MTDDEQERLDQYNKLMLNGDAMFWAKAFVKTYREIAAYPDPLIEPGWMVTWFANAMEANRRVAFDE